MTNKPNLQEMLEAYALAAGTENDHRILREMAQEYPQYAAALEDFAAARAVLKYAPDAEITAEDEARYRTIGLENLKTVLSGSNQAVLKSLTETAKSKGLNRSKFAAALGLSVSLVQYLEKRRLEFATIPKVLIAQIAEVLETGEELVSKYLNQSPVSAVNASYKTETRPEESVPKSFADAVREDQQLSLEDRQKLLDLI